MLANALRSSRVPYVFYFITMAVMIIYCVYISRQGAPGLSSFNLKFNEPLEAEFISKNMKNKITKQEQERVISLQNLRDMENIKAANSDPLPIISGFGTDWSQPNWTNNICAGYDERNCGAKLKNLETRLRLSPKYKTLSCIIQKNMSTVLQAIMCFLFDEKAFRDAGRILSKECHDNRFCVHKNEFNAVFMARKILNLTHTEMNDWKYIAIVRDPVDRFLSGFLDKCIRQPTNPKDYCNGCKANMTCFIISEYDRLQKSSYGKVLTRTFEDRHFFPQNWRCNFNTELENYRLVEYSSHPLLMEKFLNDLLQAFREQNVPEESLQFIRDQLMSGRTVHTTVISESRMFLEKRLLGSPFLMEYIIRMFYWDYRLLGFRIPTFKPIE